MEQLLFARWQFAITTVYHFLFVPLTLGLSILVAILHTQYYRTNDFKYRKMTKFWGKLFLINFALGVATGIVQEFQFGMNWSEYSRFVGDIFGAPLAIEALAAFFIESTFLGIWIFGWDKLPKLVHLISIWLVAFASNLSAFGFWLPILLCKKSARFCAEQWPCRNGELFDLITNPYVWHQFPPRGNGGHYHCRFLCDGDQRLASGQKHEVAFFQKSFKYAVVYGLIGVLAVCTIGHMQGQF